MNFTQMHERLRMELLRRIQRGALSVSLLARQTGFGQAHLSNFLHSRRQLSLEAIDRVLAAQHLTAADLLPTIQRFAAIPIEGESSSIPVVSHHTAMNDPLIRPGSAYQILHLPKGLLEPIRTRASSARRAWQRFVAVKVGAEDAAAMAPLVFPEALVLLDRHYYSLMQYRPDRPNVYAVRNGGKLTIRYAEFAAGRLVLRPLSMNHPVELLELDPGSAPGELVVGRAVLILNEP